MLNDIWRLAFTAILISILSSGNLAAEDAANDVHTANSNENRNILIGKIDTKFLTYVYEAVPTSRTDEKGETVFKARIKIYTKEDNRLMYLDNMDLDPRPGQCGEFPTMSEISFSKYGPNYVMICGNRDDKHRLVYIFDSVEDATTASSLDFGSTMPNLNRTENNETYFARIVSKLDFTSLDSGIQECLALYELNINWTPLYEHKFYKEYYNSNKQLLKNKSNKSSQDRNMTFRQYAGSMLTSLAATQDNKFICSELKSLLPYAGSMKNFQPYFDKAKEYGYPEFYIGKCKQKLLY